VLLGGAAARDESLRSRELGELLPGGTGRDGCHSLGDVVEDQHWALHESKYAHVDGLVNCSAADVARDDRNSDVSSEPGQCVGGGS
jgi:hypothetical protein